jgi:hypothetical protein
MKNKTLYLFVALGLTFGWTGCKMDYYPSDEQSSDVLLEESPSTIMDGCYSLLKDEIEYLGWPSGNTYCRHYFQMAEFPSDNICLSGKSTDPLFQATTYTMTDNLQNVGTLWMVGYKIIYMANALIASLDETDDKNRQVMGEAYFMRALIHLNMVTLYAKPYKLAKSTNNLGVPLRTDINSTEIKRDPVTEVYDQIVADLKKAAELMEKGQERGNAGYASHDAALGLLSRVYLYMEEYDKCIAVVNEALNGATAQSKLDANLATYFSNAKNSKETLFCIAHEPTEDKGQSSIGSMFNGDGGGWGEIYPSAPLLNLYERYPTDIRYTEFIKPQYKGDGPSKTLKAFIPSGTAGSEEKRDIHSVNVSYNGDNYTFSEGGTTYTIENRLIQGEYTEYYVNYKGEDLMVRLLPNNISARNTYPKYFVTKFGYQDGSPTLSSPVVLRWAEVILNAAEAYARNGDDTKALNLVDAIRERAGIPTEGLFKGGANMHGYANAIDVVMDERRLELAFEGHRMFDVYRNQQNMDRHYPGLQSWTTIKYNDPRIQYPIPNGEWTVSGIEQNPGY